MPVALMPVVAELTATTTGSTKNNYIHLVERMGPISYACRLACLVRPLVPITFTYSLAHSPRAMFFFITAILSFVWRSGSSTDSTSPTPLSPSAILGPRIAITSLFVLGLVYFMMIVKTLQNYGRTRNGVDSEMRILDPDDAPQTRSSGEGGRGRGQDREDRWRRTAQRNGSRGRHRVKEEGRRWQDGDPLSEGGVLSAVTGLGLTNLDGIPSSSSPHSSNELSREKEGAVMSPTVIVRT